MLTMSIILNYRFVKNRKNSKVFNNTAKKTQDTAMV
jgi:hypothetical protein